MLECEEISPQELLRQHMTASAYQPDDDDGDIDDKSTINKCDICFKTYASPLSLRSHLKLHVDSSYKCDFCLKSFKLESYLNMHVDRVHKKKKYVRCQVCGLEKYDQKSLTVHMRIHNDIRPHKCEVCDKTFKWRGNLDTHMLTHTGEKNYKCDVCGKEFNRDWCLKNHKYIHTNEKPYQCSVCEYACRDNSSLRKHMARHTGTLAEYKCTFCDRKYKDKWRLKSHIAEQHLNVDVSLYECHHCGKRVKERQVFKAHLNRMHYKQKKLSCPHCDRKTYDAYSMKMHMKRHEDVKPFTCQECGIAFKIKQDMKRHMAIHKKDRQHPCPECGKLFVRKHRMQKHLKMGICFNSVRCGQCGFYIRKEKYVDHVCSKRKDRKYICHHCGCRLATKNKMAAHIQQKHMRCSRKYIIKKNRKVKKYNVKKYVCDYCNKQMASKRKILLHINEKHMTDRNPVISDVKVEPDLRKVFNTPEEKNTEILKTIISLNAKDLKRVPEDVFDMYIKTKAPSKRKIPKSTGRLSKRSGRKKTEPSYVTSYKERVGNDEESCKRAIERPRRNIKVIQYKDAIELSDHEYDKIPVNTCGRKKNKDALAQVKIDKVEAKYGKYYQIKLNTVQCHVCLKLFETDDQLTDHYATHATQNTALQQNICPICKKQFPSRRRNGIFRHMSQVHKLNLNQRSNKYEEKDGKFVVKTFDKPLTKDLEVNCPVKEIEIVPTIKNMNRHKMLERDKLNRQKKVTGTFKRQLVKTKTGYYVNLVQIPLNNNIENKNEEKEDLTNDTYLEEMIRLGKAAKKEGRSMLYPCNKCDKVCIALCGLRLHRRVHDINPKPFKAKVWKHKLKEQKDTKENTQRKGIDKAKNKQIKKRTIKSKIKGGIDKLRDKKKGNKTIDNMRRIEEANGVDEGISLETNITEGRSLEQVNGEEATSDNKIQSTATKEGTKLDQENEELRLFYKTCIDSNIEFNQFLDIVKEVDVNDVDVDLVDNPSGVVNDNENVDKLSRVRNKFNVERQNKINELR